MSAHDLLAARFEEKRAHLRAVAYRMLGSVSEADDAVQEAWLRLGRTDSAAVENLGGWLTTVVARVCLDMLRSRKSRREEAMGPHVPDPIVSSESETLLADSVGLALLVVLETLAPAERLAFVLHDMFAVPFDEIAPIVGRTPTAARQLASRARRRVQNAATPERDLARQRPVVDAFLAASRAGDFDALVAILDPEVVLRADSGTRASHEIRGAEKVARGSILFQKVGRVDRIERVVVNGNLGLLAITAGKAISVVGFTIADGKILELDILADPIRLAQLALPPT